MVNHCFRLLGEQASAGLDRHSPNLLNADEDTTNSIIDNCKKGIISTKGYDLAVLVRQARTVCIYIV